MKTSLPIIALIFLFLRLFPQADDLITLWERGNQYYQLGDHASAAEIYRNLLKQNPNIKAARFNLAQSYYYLYENDQGKSYLALSIYTYEQLLESGLSPLINKDKEKTAAAEESLFTRVKDNLEAIRSGHNLNTAPRGFISSFLIGVLPYRDYLFYGMGLSFILLVISVAIILSSQPSDPNPTKAKGISQPPQRRERKAWKRLLVLATTGYFILFGAIVSLEVRTALMPLRGVGNQNHALRKFPLASATPLTQVSEGETLLIREWSESALGGRWVRVETQSGFQGWIEEKNLWVIEEMGLPNSSSETN